MNSTLSGISYHTLNIQLKIYFKNIKVHSCNLRLEIANSFSGRNEVLEFSSEGEYVKRFLRSKPTLKKKYFRPVRYLILEFFWKHATVHVKYILMSLLSFHKFSKDKQTQWMNNCCRQNNDVMPGSLFVKKTTQLNLKSALGWKYWKVYMISRKTNMISTNYNYVLNFKFYYFSILWCLNKHHLRNLFYSILNNLSLYANIS